MFRIKIKPVVFIILVTASLSSFSQTHQIKIGTDIPIQYMIGYKFSSVTGLGFTVHAGILTKPYNDIILNIIELCLYSLCRCSFCI